MKQSSASPRLGGYSDTLVEIQPRVVVREMYEVADRVIYKDVFQGDCYRVCDLPLEIKTVVDVGAHIGCFAVRMHERFPDARFVCVEANPANIEALQANVGHFADVVAAPCAYYSRAQILSTVYEGTDNTGGSFICPPDDDQWRRMTNREEYRLLERPVSTRTLEAIAKTHGMWSIDLLKLDCEGSEIDIMQHCDRSLLRTVVGEWHDRYTFMQVIADRFGDWTFDVLRDGELGLFRLSRPQWWVKGQG